MDNELDAKHSAPLAHCGAWSHRYRERCGPLRSKQSPVCGGGRPDLFADLSGGNACCGSGKLNDLYTSAWRDYERHPSATSAFSAGLATMYAEFLCSTRQCGTPPGGLDIERERKAFREAMEKDRESAYPILMYAWYVDEWREPGLLPEPTSEQLEPIKFTGSDGKIYTARQERITADPAKERRVKQLLEKAAEIDPGNPLLLYLSSSRKTDLSEKRRLLWGSMGSPGTRIWEFGALNVLRRIAGGNENELQRIRDWASKAKGIVGDSPRAKANGF